LYQGLQPGLGASTLLSTYHLATDSISSLFICFCSHLHISRRLRDCKDCLSIDPFSAWFSDGSPCRNVRKIISDP